MFVGCFVWCKMFFRNTLIAHKSLVNPYFMRFEVLKEIIQNRIQNLQKALKALCFGGFLYV